jgi:hypothetical protein
MKNHNLPLVGAFIVGATGILFFLSINSMSKKMTPNQERIQLITQALLDHDQESLKRLEPTESEKKEATDRVIEQTLAQKQAQEIQKQTEEEDHLFRRIELLAASLSENDKDIIKNLEPTNEELKLAQGFNEIEKAHLRHTEDLEKRYELTIKKLKKDYEKALQQAEITHQEELAEFKKSLPIEDPRRPRLPFAPQLTPKRQTPTEPSPTEPTLKRQIPIRPTPIRPTPIRPTPIRHTVPKDIKRYVH